MTIWLLEILNQNLGFYYVFPSQHSPVFLFCKPQACAVVVEEEMGFIPCPSLRSQQLKLKRSKEISPIFSSKRNRVNFQTMKCSVNKGELALPDILNYHALIQFTLISQYNQSYKSY